MPIKDRFRQLSLRTRSLFSQLSLGTRGLFRQLGRKGRGHWVVAGVLIIGGAALGHVLGKGDVWIDMRYSIYQGLEGMGNHVPYAKRTTIVLIGDEEYWKGEPARRVPIKRSYLAKLVKALDSADPAVIALDFDLSSPTPDGSLVEHPDYQTETREFLDVLKVIGRNRTIVVPTTVGTDDNGDYDLESDIFHDFDFNGTMITRGYIALPDDVREVPLSLPIAGGPKAGGTDLDSFAQAIVRVYNEDTLQHVLENRKDSLVYGSYLRTNDFQVLPAGKVLTTDISVLRPKLAHKIVIVGAGWHRYAYERGPQIDTYFTPVGWIPGVFIHANYVEALLDSRTYRPVSEAAAVVIEVVLALLVAATFALEIGGWQKLLVISALCLLLTVSTYVLWQNLGLFFDFFIPALLVSGHSAFEQIRAWRRDAHKYASQGPSDPRAKEA